MSESLELSKEHQRFCSLMKCPLCHQFPIIPHYFQGDGQPIPRNVAISNMDRSAIAECPRCRKRWSVFASFQASTSSQPVQLHQEPQKALEVAKLQIIETDRWEEPLGSDRRTIDNSKGTGRVTRKLTVSKEWTKTYTVDVEKAVKAQGEAGFDLFKLVNLKTTLEGELRKKYSVSESVKNTYTDEVSVEIEPSTKVQYCFHWKQTWQKGVIQCLDRKDQPILSVPFQVVVGITFDILSE